ncbi:polysaccharide deacetylase family protein [Rufibacter immobilis]|uniref:polysaccharide deacetylase family protein n=1 Tax=Rufibacter immobilis TaxID=1348778 RepID=UPI0035E73A45
MNRPIAPGLSLSFDDRAIDKWFDMRDIFKQYNARVTFFITQPDSLSQSEVEKLRILKQDGHEIGFHGTHHVVSEFYIRNKSYSEYFSYEITPGLKLMDSLGFKCTSFAYPYGSRYWFTDFLLLRKFKVLRGVSSVNKEKTLTKIDDIFFSLDKNRKLSAVGIDVNSGVDEKMLENAINRAITRKEVLLLYGHIPTNNREAKGYIFKVSFLKFILEKAKSNGLKFYTMSELATNNNNK